MKNTLKKSRREMDAYLQLVREIPLRPIRSETEQALAGKVLNRLIGSERSLTTGERDYMEALAELSKSYEVRVHRMVGTKMSPIQAIRYLMEEHNMNTEALGKVLGNQPAASLFLTGKRPLSKSHIFKLAQRFKVDPGLFLGSPEFDKEL